MKQCKKLFIATSNFGPIVTNQLQRLKAAAIEYVFNPYKKVLTTDQLIECLKDAPYLIAGTEKITENVFRKNPQLRIISRCGVGMDNIDILAAKKYNVLIKTVASTPELAVAELTLALMLNLLRNVGQADADIRSNAWNKYMGSLLTGKTVGILGFGKIGQKIFALLTPFQVNCLIYDLVENLSVFPRREKQFLPLKEVLKRSDIVTIHLPYTTKTHYLIDTAQLKLMKPTAVLINTSRGGIINEKALIESLTQGKIKGAALDVFEQEPYQGPLAKMKNVVLTAHMGSYTSETRAIMEYEAMEGILEWVQVNQSNKDLKRG